MLRFWLTLRLPVLPVFIICSRRSWIFASNWENSAHTHVTDNSTFPHQLTNMHDAVVCQCWFCTADWPL